MRSTNTEQIFHFAQQESGNTQRVSETLCANHLEGVVAQLCNPLTLQLEQSGGVGSRYGRASPLERHDKGLRT